MKPSNPCLTHLLVAVALLLAAGTSAAQTRLGKTELGFSFDLDDLTEGGDAELRMTLRAGRYLGDGFEVGAELGSNGTFDDVTDNVAYRLFAVYELNPGATAVWYGRGGYSGFRLEGFSFSFLDLGLGFKSYLRDDTALYWEATYGYALSGPQRDGSVRSVTGLVCTF